MAQFTISSPKVRVHNITDRPNSPEAPHALKIAGQTIRPGKYVVVGSDELSKKARSLHGSAIWVGNQVPSRFKATSKSALRDMNSAHAAQDPMSIEEARSYLAEQPRKELLSLCQSMSPALSFSKEPSNRMLSLKIARAAFSDSRALDPENFFWLRRWVRKGSDYSER